MILARIVTFGQRQERTLTVSDVEMDNKASSEIMHVKNSCLRIYNMMQLISGLSECKMYCPRLNKCR